ncbi:hypothetical protein AJ80_09190 [Polytolypa hystricis UAMH7299]|uniref:FAD/NAD(P)-binding domain-containing protein n=1 Tax=Polytolypa hystricis (strain UAMH7299) TaxID=1447883 RepID=A0A2B7WUI9_POLH7|nr:hypothetical protein AJ80_09190 [Polytolypa hystricis UAMH7299]
MEYESFDIAIIGAGVYGLAAAKAHLTLHPTSTIIILESAHSIGGVWAQERLYPGLALNNLLGTYEFSDFPMDTETFGVRPGEHVPGEVVHRYLRAYAEDGGFYDRIRFGCKVEVVERVGDDDGWVIGFVVEGGDVSNNDKETKHKIHAAKVIIATGTCSEPHMPTFRGSESFDAPIFHSKHLAAEKDTIKNAKNVVILAGSKSGYDAAYMAATWGVEVDWVLRESGRGAIWISPKYVTPLKKWLEKLVNTRLLTWFSPCIWGDADGFGGIRRLLHGTAVGRWIVDKFWWVLGNDVLTLNRYDEHPETKKLEPWTDAFWAATSFSILNYPTDFFDLVRQGKIRVHVSDISHLSAGTVHLTSGESIPTDALISSTGWTSRPTFKFLPQGIDTQLGLSYDISAGETPDKLAQKADAEILKRFPRLKNQPTVNNPYIKDKDDAIAGSGVTRSNTVPFRLYRHIVPPAFIHDRSIGFVGLLSNFSMLLTAQAQALWLAAYFDGKLPLLEPSSPSFDDDIRWDAVLNSQFAKWRYPFGNPQSPDFVFDFVPYVDWLLGDLGLKVHRKKGRLAEWLEPYGPEDYKGLIEEWKESLQK